MIELLVLITIATIGVVYTSSTGEAESKAMAEKTAKDALNEAEGQTGIGVLGIDVVARKARDMLNLKNGAVSAASLALKPVIRDEDKAEDDLGDAVAEDQSEVAETEAAPQPAKDDIVAGSDMDMDDDWGADWDDDDWDANDEEEVQAERHEDAVREHAPLPKTAEIPDTSNAPLVEDFDPEQDQIVIAYRPGEAGNGRIGIAEDPLRPGSACVTLGGRCVAVVVKGFGKVRAHHIELVCEEDGDDELAA